LLNLSGVMLRLAKPVLEDPEKLKKVDWSFLHWSSPMFTRPGSNEKTPLFPRDSTPLSSLNPSNIGLASSSLMRSSLVFRIEPN
jgi:hypothetical protein